MAQEPTIPAQGDLPDAVNVIAIASGKGGVGKTWLAVTLTHACSRNDLRALLFDGDLGLANVDIQLGHLAKSDLANVFSGQSTLKQLVTSYEGGGFDIVAGQSGTGSLANLPLQRLVSIRNDLLDLAGAYDRVIIDLGAGVERTVQILASTARTTLVVVTDEPTSLTDAYAFIKVTLARRPDADLRVVVNIAESRSAGEKTYETLLKACSNFLNYEPPLAGIIRRDMRVRESIRNQTPLLTRHPTSEAASDVEAIVKRLLDE